MTTNEVVDIYKGMWIWIRDNLNELKDGHLSVHEAKLEYLGKKKKVFEVIGSCILCESYDSCLYCSLGNCSSRTGHHSIVRDFLEDKYWQGILIPLSIARESCDRIIAVHEELQAHPTKKLLNKLKELVSAERAETGVENVEESKIHG